MPSKPSLDIVSVQYIILWGFKCHPSRLKCTYFTTVEPQKWWKDQSEPHYVGTEVPANLVREIPPKSAEITYPDFAGPIFTLSVSPQKSYPGCDPPGQAPLRCDMVKQYCKVSSTKCGLLLNVADHLVNNIFGPPWRPLSPSSALVQYLPEFNLSTFPM